MLVPSNSLECVRAAGRPGRRKLPGGQATAPPPTPAYHAVVRHHWWKGVLFVICCTFLAYQISIRMKPMYETTATVEVDDQQPTGVIGKDAEKPFPTNDSDEFLGTQVKLVQSDNVLRPVA